tara:strand:- start:2256 stop:3155 length:900 start_codon:yes stop_codon:yes gene_type:complete
MSFLDNSGDIILDAVLTDTGRMRLAKGDGSFRIAKFTLGDDEIDYGLFVSNTGSAYQDLSILQTPVLEAFTNNDSSLKSTLLSISDENLLYLPVIKLNEVRSDDVDRHGDGVFIVAVNKETEDKFDAGDKVMGGNNPDTNTRVIELNQGIDNNNIPATRSLSSELVETSYLLTLDSRFGTIISPTSTSEASLSFTDDDGINNYYVTDRDQEFITMNANTNADSNQETIAGSRGSILKFRIMASLDLLGGSYFDDLGGTDSIADTSGTSTYKFIDTTLQVKGVSTGYRVDLPIRFIKFSS